MSELPTQTDSVKDDFGPYVTVTLPANRWASVMAAAKMCMANLTGDNYDDLDSALKAITESCQHQIQTQGQDQ